MAESRFGRRAFLGGVAAAGGAAVLAACGSTNTPASDSSSAGAGGSPSGGAPATGASSATGPSSAVGSSASGGGGSGVVMPAFAADEVLKPDLPPAADGLRACYKSLPPVAKLPAFWQGPPPGNGGDFTAFTYMNTTPKAVGSNHWWQAINKAIGVNLKLEGSPGGQPYADKFAVTVAGGDLPDVMVVEPAKMSGLTALFKARMVDLTDYVGGSAVSAYKGLANIPTYAWQAALFGGRIFGVPYTAALLQTSNMVATDLIAGDASPSPTNGTELLALMKSLSDVKHNKWATPLVWFLLNNVNEMVGTPNQWSVSDGKFTKDYESPQYKQALDVVRQCWAGGYIHPNAFQPSWVTYNEISSLVESGTCGYLPYSFSLGYMATVTQANPKRKMTSFTPVKWDGGGMPKRYVGTGAPYFTVIPKASPDRVKEILSIIDWFAAPWGTQEWMLKDGGVAKIDYALNQDGTMGKRTPVGTAEVGAGWEYIGNGPPPHYFPFNPDIAVEEYQQEKAGLADVAPLPTKGLESDTNSKQGPALAVKMQNAAADIIQGRKPVSAWDEAVKTWQSSGGNSIRSEYEKAYAAATH